MAPMSEGGTAPGTPVPLTAGELLVIREWAERAVNGAGFYHAWAKAGHDQARAAHCAGQEALYRGLLKKLRAAEAAAGGPAR